jgi:hypothetical protein
MLSSTSKLMNHAPLEQDIADTLGITPELLREEMDAAAIKPKMLARERLGLDAVSQLSPRDEYRALVARARACWHIALFRASSPQEAFQERMEAKDCLIAAHQPLVAALELECEAQNAKEEAEIERQGEAHP